MKICEKDLERTGRLYALADKIIADIELSLENSADNKFTGIRNAVFKMVQEKPIYRIMIKEDNSIETDCYDMIDLFKPELNKLYSSIDELPEWVKDKIAVLSVLNPDLRNEEVEGVGRRITKNVFWVYKE
jgi:hypothetical protein